MAEVFGIVASALSVAALFNNCVDCFEYIQIGRDFGRDYERSQLRLDILKSRLGRWGEAVRINEDFRFSSESPSDKLAMLIKLILEDIFLQFESAYKTSKRYELSASSEQDLELFRDGDMDPIPLRQHNRMRALAKKRQKLTSLSKKIVWALYDRNNMEHMISQIAVQLDELEKLQTVEPSFHKFAEIEIEEVVDEPSLQVLKTATLGIDSALSEAATKKLAFVAARNSAKDVSTQDRARVQVGNVTTATGLGREVLVEDHTINSAGTIAAKGDSGVHIGNTYGGDGIWDKK